MSKIRNFVDGLDTVQIVGAFFVLFMLFTPEVAFAMPWDGPLASLKANLTGTVAQSVAAIVFVVTGLLIAFGEVNGILGTVLRIALGLSFALMATQWIGMFGGG